MNEFKGTSGPWQVVNTYEDYNEDSGIIIWDGDEQASGPICDMGMIGDMNYGETLANAHLIASAPELLELLGEAKEMICSLKLSMLIHPDFEEGSEFDDMTSGAQEVEDKIEASIAKALGQ